MAVSQAQLDAFKNVALQQGYNPAEVDSFMTMAQAGAAQKQANADKSQADELGMYEKKLQLQQKYSGTSSQPGALSEIESKAISEGNAKIGYDEATGTYKVTPQIKVDPLVWAADNQVFKHLTGKSKEERYAQAEAMQKLGVDGYMKSSALPDLLTEKELTARDTATGLLNSASSIYSQVQDRNGKAADVEGVGILGKFRPGFMTNEAGRTLRQEITGLTAAKMKEISGAAISDREVQRLSKALPQIGDPESVIMTKSKNIADSLEIGLQMQEVAKRERLTLDQAYKKYGAEAFKAKDQPVPEWIAGKPGLDIGKTDTNKIGRFEVKVK